MKVEVLMAAGHGGEYSEDRMLILDSVLSRGHFSCDLSPSPSGVIGIFDGVGGFACGAAASRCAAWRMSELPPESGLAALRAQMEDISRALNTHVGGATTATGLVLGGGRALLFHVGNTRMYALRGGYLEQITEDQTLVEDRGLSGASAAAVSHVITGCLGGGSPHYVERLYTTDYTAQLLTAQKLLLACDGIHEYVDVDKLEQYTLGLLSADDILQTARDSGSEDDLTLCLVDCELAGC